MSNRRKSAFPAYAQTRVEQPKFSNIISSKPKKTTPKSHILIDKNLKPKSALKKTLPTRRIQFKALDGGIKKRKFALMNRKERSKYSQLPAKTLKESIRIFRKPKHTSQFPFANSRSMKNKFLRRPTNIAREKFTKPTKQTKMPQTKTFRKQKASLIRPLKKEKYVSLNELIDQDMFDSRQEAIKLFKHIISPVKNREFFKVYWEKRPMLVKRDNSEYNKDWFSCKEFDFILRNHNLEFVQNVDVISYINNEKQKHDLEGRAYAPLVWDFFQQGCTIKLINPQTYSKRLWQYLSILQESFGTQVGANVSVAPAGAQTFAPHFANKELFVLQLEGKKRWKIYNPIEEEILPRNSGSNYKESEIGEPIFDVILEPGDLLYFPRGFFHQPIGCDDIHSLHITLSCYQTNTWGDFLLKLLPSAIETAMEENIEFRQGLPINYLMHNGVAYDDEELKKPFIEKTASLMSKLVKYAPIDLAVDQMAKQFLRDSLPPCYTESEKARSIHGSGERWNEKKKCVDNVTELDEDTLIKLIRKNSVRLVIEQEACFVYHNLENARITQDKEPRYIEVESDFSPAIEFLINSYPNYVTVEELPIEKSVDEKLEFVSNLYNKGLIVTGEPLETQSEIETEDYEAENEETFDDVLSEITSENNLTEKSDEENDENEEESSETDKQKPGKESRSNNYDQFTVESEEDETYQLDSDEYEGQETDTEDKKLRKYRMENAGDYGVEIDFDPDDEQDDTYDEYESGIGFK